ncbi:DUF397 domain-containing protein [Streptomyces graminilatus]|uniref:DUF397 domain-containing protein n=1 Tax=Streptomyces graminilatus TaxID=1464070 RepID=UPI0006E319FA|nr:DUF397 domain-containing protein [Streptomyces graminilatus]
MHSHPIAPELAPENAWFKSSYSDAMQNCVEAALITPAQAWFKSSYSDGTGQNCVEASRFAPPTGIAIRDSKNATGPALRLGPAPWRAFVTHLCEGPSTQV